VKRANQEILKSKYPKLFPTSLSAEGKFTTGFQCQDGWFTLLDNLFGSIYRYCSSDNKEYPYLVYLKSKFGYLAIHFENSDEVIFGMKHMASHMSTRTCEFCGTMRNVGQTQMPWIYTCCELCYEGNQQGKDLTWAPND